MVIFHLKMRQTKPKLYCMEWIAECQTLNICPQICLGVWITTLAHAKCLCKIIFGHNYCNCEPIFKLFAALFTTFGLQKDGMVIF